MPGNSVNPLFGSYLFGPMMSPYVLASIGFGFGAGSGAGAGFGAGLAAAASFIASSGSTPWATSSVPLVDGASGAAAGASGGGGAAVSA